jgi:hypothetical protein
MTPSEHSAINRANAQHSTGPRTEEGKKKSSLNALRHGLTGQIVVMPTDDLEAYRRHLESFTNEYNPKGATEENLTQSLADTSWRLNRVAALESNLLSLATGTTGDPLQDAMNIAAALESQTKALANLSMHTQRLSRQFERAVKQLRELQKVRKERETIDLNKLLDIKTMYETVGDTFDPAEVGFVFSDQQIHAHAQSRRREKLAQEAFSFLY